MPSKLEDYEILYKIGSGSYGTCKKIRRKADGKILLWKEMDYGTMTETEKQMLVSEVNLLRELKHQHIVRYYDRIVDRSHSTIYIVMEFCEGGDLSAIISKCKRDRKYLEEDFVWKILSQTTLALQECHRRGSGRAILHRDLKPANVFLDANHNVKLGDFGLARVLSHDTSFAKTFVGTPYYMSPEQMNHQSYNEKSDIWSLGCLIYELCALSPPFTAVNQKALAVKIKDGTFKSIPHQYSADLNTLIFQMLKVNSILRPSIEEILKHPRLSSIRKEKDKRSSSQPELQQQEDELLKSREKQIEERERKLEQRERELETKEKALSIKEKLIDGKFERAEAMFKQCQALKTNNRVHELKSEKVFTDEIYPNGVLKTKDSPKKVHFKMPGKENETHENTKMSKALQERLQKANQRTDALRKLELISKMKSKRLLAMR
ncbi:serine/threonine-protein kinase Nek2-like [Anneissia japonica]|uniref:serine/threonine-protein kinase Nek2-like n=1 Tax=Anneissia japonica TaxID=1529436 RepID=UPI0014255025|nr:serine/threonine-protein kinase Nek2-like [Anneissia japonica]XP_033115918.1 serine/threonine-protein kinase Nek2-like [Anneissia japonica]